MAMTIRLPQQLDERLTLLAQKTDRAKSYYLIQALESYLEDMEDLFISNAVIERIKVGKEKTYSMEEVKRELNLDD